MRFAVVVDAAGNAIHMPAWARVNITVLTAKGSPANAVTGAPENCKGSGDVLAGVPGRAGLDVRSLRGPVLVSWSVPPTLSVMPPRDMEAPLETSMLPARTFPVPISCMTASTYISGSRRRM